MKSVVLYLMAAVLRRPAILLAVSVVTLLFHNETVSGANCSSPFFVAGSTFPAGSQPVSLAVGDFNADGKADLAIANQFSANVSIRLGRGDGTFLAAVNYDAGTGPSSVLARDLNNDGKLDLVVSDVGSADIWVLLGNGNGTFQNAVFYDLPNTTQEVAAGDLNGDGKVDLVVAQQLDGGVSVLTGNGNGTFNVGAEVLVGVDPVSVAMGDFNRDGKLDVAVANASFEDKTFSSVSILIGRGTGAFFGAVDYDAGTSPRSVTVGDFNADGKPDLAVANYGFYDGTNFTESSVSILIGSGTGTFAAPVNYAAGEGPNSIVAADLNGDGKLDLAVSNFRSMDVSILFGRGDGTFQPPINSDAGASPRQVAVGSFNTSVDTNLDLAFVHENGAAVMLATCITSDLGITQTGPTNPVPMGNNVTYTMIVTNGGPDTVPDTTVTDQLPPGLSFVSMTTSQGNCSNNGGAITCSLGSMTNGARVTLTLTATTTAGGSINNTSVVSSVIRPDPNPGNNNAVFTITVIPIVSLSATDPNAAEAGPNVGVFTVSRTGTSGSLVVTYTIGGTAANGPDYSFLSGSVTIPNNFSSTTITLVPVDDTIAEPNETVILTLVANSTYTVNPSSSTGTVTITDNDVYPVSISDATVTEGNSGTVDAVFTVSLAAASSQTVTINYATANGTAVAGADYISTNGTVTFPPGTTSQTVVVKVLGDVLNETNETFFVNLSNPVNTIIGDGLGVATINNDDPVPGVSISDVTVLEKTSGTTNAIFTVSLSAASGQTVSVNYGTSDGTANAGSDYVATSGTLTFPPGTTTQTLTVVVNGDIVGEVNETFFVTLSAAANAAITDGQGQGTIINAAPAISVADVAVTEVNSGTIDATFTATLSFTSPQTVSFTYATANGTATAGADYVPTNGVVTFAPGTTNQTIIVRVLGDVLNEANETFFLNLTNATNGFIGDSQTIGTINNDDPLPSLTINDVSVTEPNSGTVNAVFTVNLSAVSGQTVSIDYDTADGSASAGSDYAAASGTLSFPPGVVTQTISVAVNGDLLNEANETFSVNLSNVGNALVADGQGIGTINNDDPLPSLSISDVAVNEGNSGSFNALFTVSLSAVSGQTVTINFATANGTATAGNDYVATNGVMSFAPGTTTQAVIVKVNGDVFNEADETVFLNLSNPSNALLSDSQGVGTILNDDPLPALSITDVTLTEGNSGTTNAVFTLTLSAVSGRAVTVNYATVDGTAASGSDYAGASGTVTFPQGTTTQTIVVAVNGDLINEANETFFVNLSNPVGASLQDNQGVATILNDDPLPSLSINDATVTEGNGGAVGAVFTVSLSAASGQTVTVNYGTADGTATAGTDYFSFSGVLTFAPGVTSQNITVSVVGDALNEANETFFVNLSNPVNVTLNDNQGVGTINNDDPVPSLSINDLALIEGNTGTNAVLSVRLSTVSGQSVSVSYATASGTAATGSDFVATNGILTFSPGVTTQSVSVAIIGDLSNESNETFFVNLSGAVNAIISDTQGIGTINNDDPQPSITINDTSVFEGNSGTTNMPFTVSLSAPSGFTVSATYATADGTAGRQNDYVRIVSGVVTFAPGQTNAIINVTVNGDVQNESNETLLVTLSSPVNATLARSQATGTILNDDGVALLSINDVTVTEGNSGAVDAVFNVHLAAAPNQSVTVNYATADGTAAAGSDYIATNGVLSFPVGVTDQTVTVKVLGDNLSEANETFFVNLSGSVNAVINDPQGVGTISNDDTLPNVVINDVSIAEGNSGSSSLIFTVTLSPAGGQTATVNFATADGTATAGSDYTANSGILTFSPGVTSQTIAVSITGDTVNEPNETLFVNLSNPVNANVADAQGVGTINNDDGAPTISIANASVVEGNSGTTNAVFTVTLSAASSQTVTVSYASTNGTALAGTDYVSTNGLLTFVPGVTTQTVVVKVTGDLVNEADETFVLDLSAPTNATLSDSQAVGTILNDDALPLLSIGNVSVNEGNSGTVGAAFTVTLSPASAQTVTVNYATANGTATAGSDYLSTSGTLTFSPGITSQTITVTVNGDTASEPNETFLVNLSAPVNAALADGPATGTIVDDDGLPTISISNVAVAEGNSGTTDAAFTVTLSASSGQTVTATYATANGTATAGSDFVSTNGTISFAPGTTSQTIVVKVNGDTANEGDETFFVNLSNPVNATLADTQGTGTINNDDALGGLSISDVAVTEGNSGTTNAVFRVTLPSASGQTVTVAYATANGTATAGSDYVATNGVLSFAAGTTTQFVTVRVNGDLLNETNETFFVNLSNPTNATIGDSQAIGTINNDDPLPAISIGNVTVTEGNSGTTDAAFTVSLSAASGQAVTVNFATADGTATANADYLSTNGLVTFAPGTTSQIITVKVNGDLINEPAETFVVNLSNPANATLTDNQGQGTINNDDSATSLSINDVTLTEGNSGTTNAIFTVSVSSASGQTVTVNYATADDTALQGSDYVATNGILSFAPGTTIQTITVAVLGDTLSEANETFFVNLSNPVNASVADGQGIGTINNDDGAPTVSVSDVTVVEGQNGTTNAVFTVTLSSATSQFVTVNYQTADGTALAGSDYVSTNGSISFAPGVTSQPITVRVNGDLSNEPNETFFVNLTFALNATIADNQGQATIIDDDGAPSLTIVDAAVVEGNSGTVNALFTVSLSVVSADTITVNFATTNGTATAGTDYVSTNGVLTFAPGVTTQTITVRVNGDLSNESNETFLVNLSNATNAALARAQAVGTINNDDSLPALSIGNVTVIEGNTGTSNAVFAVTLSAASGQTISVAYATSGDTATPGTDFISTNGILTFAAGVTTQSVTVRVNGDLINEPTETFFVNLSNPTNATISDAQAVGTINDNDVLPAITITDGGVTEGNSGVTNAVLTVRLSVASGQTVSVNYATADGMATSGVDYLATNGVVTFAPGTTAQNVFVPVLGDLLNESNETFFVNLSSAVNATISDSQGIGTITNDDPMVSISITDAGVFEGNTGSTNAQFVVTLSGVSGQAITVNYATADGTASRQANDYVRINNSVLTFPAGTTNQIINVSVTGDTLVETNETFFVNLSSPVNATLANSDATGLILNDDGVPTVSVLDTTVTEGNSGTVNASFTVRLSAASSQLVTVNYATANGTALAGTDYLAGSGLVSFAPGVINQTVTVQVVGDPFNEPNETFLVNLSSSTNALISDAQAVGTINNDDSLPTLSIGDVSVVEGDSGATSLIFTVSLFPASGQTVGVNFATADGTATAGSDYTSTNGSLTFAPGVTSGTIAVSVSGDLLNEANETLFVNLSGAVNATVPDGQAVGTINNDDPVPTLSINNATVVEGNFATTDAIFTLTLSQVSGQTVTVNYGTANGTAIAGSDYIAASGTVTFPPGAITQTITVPVNGDLLNEANETFFVNLSNPQNVTIIDGQGLGTINNDDPLPALSINNVTVTERDTGVTNAVFTVTLSPASGQTVTVNYATADASAAAGADYISTNGIVTFAPGTTTQTISVAVLGETINESNETFVVTLSNPGNATLADNQGVATINNDDPFPTISIDNISLAEGNSGQVNAVFTVSLSVASGQTVSANYATADGTAAAGTDFVSSSGIVTFLPGTTTRSITVPVNGDLLNELDETFLVNLSSPANATLADSQGQATILNDDPLPSISIANTTVSEGDSGTTSAQFTVSLSGASGQAVTVDYATANGTAVAGADYVATNGTITFAPGAISQTVTVRVTGDLVNEANETFFVNLSNPIKAGLADGQAIGTINNDDPVPGLSISDVAVMEGDSDTVNAVFTVSLSTISGQSVSANYATANGSAVSGADYVATSGVVSFAPGITTQTITVAVNGDTINEADEIFFMNLSAPANAILTDSQGMGTILNDDPLPIVTINDITVTEGNSGSVNAVFTLNLFPASGQTVSVNYATANGTALSGSDYTSTNGTATFAPGATSQTITVRVNGDVINEPNETFALTLSNPTNTLLADLQAFCTINNDDPLPTVSVNDATVSEGNSGTTAVFTVNLSAVSGQSVTVNYSTADGTALAGSDYVATNGTVTFAPGTTSQTVSVAVLPDTVNEANETFFLNLSNPVNSTLADVQAIGTINNDDPFPTLSINDVTVTEGDSGTVNAVFTVNLSIASGQIATVNYATASGTAVGGSDYVSTSGTLTFAPGSTAQTISVAINGDLINEANETFFVNLFSAVNATLGDVQGAATINNDDPLPSITLDSTSVTEGNSGTTTAFFTVSLSAVSGQTVSVNYATANGTAIAGTDYVSTNGTVVFPPGSTTQTIAVRVNGDPFNEPDETFLLNLSAPVNAVIGDAQTVGTINNDDPLPTLSINNVVVTEGNTGTTNANFSVTLSTASGQAVTVNYATINDTATAGTDFTSTNGTLTFAPGVTTQTITVRVNGDLLNEANETFFAALSNPSGATISSGLAVCAINNDDAAPAMTITDAGVIEGNSGTVNALFSVRLSVASGQTISVNFATANGSAVAGVDYAGSNGTLSFPPGTTTQNLSVPVFGDLLNEVNETFFVNLSNPQGATLTDSQGIGTITNDDPVVSISISDTAVFESNSGTTNAQFLVSLSAESGQTVTVTCATADGTASRASDYVRVVGTVLTFPPGTTTQTLNVAVSGDTSVETNETFFVSLSSPVNATLGNSQATGLILNDDGVPSISINDVTVTEGNSGVGNAVFNVRLSAASSQLVSVRYTTADGTATAGSDYAATNGFLNFSPGTTNLTVTVKIFADQLNEPSETFFVDLLSSTNALISDPRAVGTISNDDVTPTLSIADVTVIEGDSGTMNVLFDVVLSAASAQTVSVRFATSDGTATVGSDYTATNGVLVFAPGSTLQTLRVSVIGDTVPEPNETFFVNLSNPTNATLSDLQAVGTIFDDDSLDLVLSTSQLAVPEGSSNAFTVRLNGQPASDVNILVHFESGDADLQLVTAANLLFTPSNWNVPQTVRLSADEDTDALDGQALFSLSAPKLLTRTLTAIEVDNDAAAQITRIQFGGGSVTVSFTTGLNRAYRLERADTLPAGPWTTAVDQVAGTGSVVSVTDVGGAGQPRRFYRIRRIAP